MKYRSLTALSALIALSAIAPAQFSNASAPKGLENVQAELDAWRAEHGPNWQIKFDDAMGYARFLYGGNAAPAFTPHRDADYLALAREVARDTYKMHGIEVSTLVDNSVVFLPLSNAGSSDKMTVEFRQVVNGVPVEGGFLNVLFDLNGRVLSVDTTAMPGVANMLTKPAISSERAGQIALERFYADASAVATDLSQPELVIFKDTKDELPRAVLCWKATAQYLDGQAEAEGFTYFLDANSGRQVARENAIHNCDVGGTVTALASPGTRPDVATNLPTAAPLANMTITSAQGNALSDANGNFNIVGATPPLTATFRFNGPFCNVSNSGGAAYTTSPSLPLASGNNVLMNSPAAALVTSQANAFNWTNLLRNWTRTVNPADAVNDFLAQANVNINSSCNAFFNGSSTNFYIAAGGCVNTAYSTVVIHETGHWLNVRYSSGNGSDGFGEGNADNFATYATDQPILGAEFQGGGFIRTGTNTRQFCGDANPGCHGGVHADGEVLMGACWKVRVNLKNSLGSGPGSVAANTIFNAWMVGYNDTQIKTIVETHWLTLDDNDGNISNGTPNFTAIEGGFRTQGFPQIQLAAVSISGVTNLPDTTNTVGPYTVNATVVALLNPPLTVVQLKYRVNGGTFNTVGMLNTTGDSYTGSIPGQACPSNVEYYVTATNSGAQSANFPATAPGSGNLDFIVGTVQTAFTDNFQTDQGWVATFVGATAGFWQRGVPVNDGTWDYDPVSDGDGSGSCYLTQNTLGNSDVDGGSVTLTSPTMDMSSTSYTLAYRYFLNLTNTNGTDRLLVEANNNGGVGTWTTVALHTANNGLAWTPVSLTRAQMVASGFTPSATSKIRFTANDGGTASINESGVDGVVLSTVGGCGPACPTPVVYCTAKVNALGCTPAIGTSGQASATAPSGFFVFADAERNQKPGFLLYSIDGRQAVAFTGGLLCVAPAVRRSTALDSGGSPLPASDCTGIYAIDMNSFARGTLGGTPIPELSIVGTIVQAQFWGRDPGFAPPDNTSLSDAAEYIVCQ